MMKPVLPEDEVQRLQALHDYQILDTPPEEEFDELVQLASQTCDTPVSLISLIDSNRQWFKARVGLEAEETPRDFAFCAHAIHNDKALVVNDATQDERFVDNPLVASDPNIRFYAGLPLITPRGYRLGTLCVIDVKPRTLSDEQLFALKVLSKQVIKQLELKRQNQILAESLNLIHDQNKELTRLNHIGDRLISIISHDLSSPLSSIKGVVSLLNQEELTKEEIQYVTSNITLLIDSSSELLEQLLHWGNSKIRGDALNLEPIRLHSLIEKKIDKFKPLTEPKGNIIINKVDPSYDLLADPILLKFVIRNLIQNANKFTEAGTIEIGAEHNEKFHILTIKDSGCGMSPEQMEKLFDWTNRFSKPGTSNEKGSGLGLLICREFVEKHGGSIVVCSEVNVGSTFSFTLRKDGISNTTDKKQLEESLLA